MELTVVGSSGSVSGPDSPASSYLVRAPFEGGTFALVLDLGPGSMGALYRYLDPRDVGAVALSHLHTDHCLDLCAFYVGARYSPSAPWPSIPLLAPPGARERLVAAYRVPGEDAVEDDPETGIGAHFQHRDWAPTQRVGPFRLDAARVVHPVETYAVRVTEEVPDGGSLVFSGDTGPCEALVELATGADLLLAEASFRDVPGNPPDLHLTGREAAEAAHRAGVGSLVLTHIPPWHDRDAVLAEALPHFDGPVALAAPGAAWTIGPR
ncbi:Ribonuclease BN, tRNA processing enzyme [Friedmanniella luteola]|uniref:Ribonuclease BN, tRNA processing enzyme n=1 Tax=Friedmanniella luteola TaxID=546871 RepID=A0A1H1YB71_9ACTN|nr:MBL fold metallo-hydrolase [Friedmanniella luteola]SDT18256.1 Ribonuclease BN, tRNA processing enzyme [Friedmanniella luteola]